MSSSPGATIREIYYPLRITYGLVPILAGLDKFFGILTDWETYLPSIAVGVLPISPTILMMIVGVIEIIAGLLVLTTLTRWGAYVVAVWLTLIAMTVASAGYLDIAVRDLVMAVGAYTLGKLEVSRGKQWILNTNVMEGA